MDRCPTCGGRRVTWSPARIIEAAQSWAETHGAPPSASQWYAAGPNHPNNATVFNVFGSWNAMIAAAGFEPRGVGGQRPVRWTREACESALFEWAFAHGRVPRARDWKVSGPDHPAEQTIRKVYGSWNAFVVAAGYEPKVKYRTVEGYARQAGAAARDRDERGRLVTA